MLAVCILFGGALSASAIATLGSDEDTPSAAVDSKTGNQNSRAVRLSDVEGNVKVVLDGEILADPAFANVSLFEGSQIITANDGQAEIQMEDGSVVRISPNSTLTLSVLQHQGTGTRTELVLNNGLAYFELQPSNAEHSLRVNYGTVAFAATSFSVVRLEQDTPPGALAVFSGNVHVERGDSLQLDIHGGESLNLNASDGSGYNIAESIEQNSWDSWNSDRDQALNAQSAERTTATRGLGNYDGVGMNDLDANGSWYNVPDEGYVWSPYEAQSLGVGWDPYGYGHWVYYPRYGYTWVSGYGWGFAPYQCGLWNYYDNFGWGWAPGGGCNPWWGGRGFFGGGGYNIRNSPHGYRPPKRPGPGPIPPHPVGPNPHPVIHPILRAGLTHPSVPIDRRAPGSTDLPIAGRPAGPVQIAGHTVEPLRPIAPRQSYDRAPGVSNGFVGRPPAVPQGGYYGGAHPVYGGGRPVQGQMGSRPSPPSSHPQPSQPSHSSFGGGSAGASHPAPAGGGGGGGGHPSGGGGGGGATHK